MAYETRYDGQKDPETLEREIDEVRSEMSRTLAALEERFSPGRLLDYYLGMAREHGGEFAANLGNSVKQNPVPMMLTAIGLIWTMISSKDRRPGSDVYSETYLDDEGVESPSTGERIKERAANVRNRLVGSKDAVRDKLVGSRDAVRDRIGSARDRLGSATRTTQEQARRAREGFNSMLEEQPLMLGALGIIVGAAVGAMLPRTEQEDRLIGKARDRTVSRVKESAAGAYDKARETISETSQHEHAMSNQNIGAVNTERHPAP
jgi:ElaB/YqjD/DUF883 family membrane-anchored ribosome-binding protein